MTRQYDYQCGKCGAIHTEQEWNDHTFIHVKENEDDPDCADKWEDDEYFFPLAKAIEDYKGAWFYCPSCDEEAYANRPDTVLPVYRDFKNNKGAKSLLEENY